MSKKKVYILYSIIGQITPKIYRTKASVQKNMLKDQKLFYYQFPNQKSAVEYLSKLQAKSPIYNDKIDMSKQKIINKKDKIQEKQSEKIEKDTKIMNKKKNVETKSKVKKQQKVKKQKSIKKNNKQVDLINHNKISQVQIKQQFQFNRLKLKNIPQNDKIQLFRTYKKFNPFYTPTQLFIKQNNLNLTVQYNRGQNPGFTTALYKFSKQDNIIYQNYVNLGITRNYQATLQGTCAALMDIIYSKYFSGAIKLCLQQQIISKGQKSLDIKIRQITSFVKKVRNIGFQI